MTVKINTISAMEKPGAQTLSSGLDKVTAIMKVLKKAGVEFLNHGQPVVRLRLPERRRLTVTKQGETISVQEGLR